MSIYKGTTLIAGALPDAANQSLSNLNSTGQNKIDGAFVNTDGTIATNVSLNGTTALSYTLSFLPNDNYNYEVLIVASVLTGATSGNQVTAGVFSDLITASVGVCRAQTRTSSVVTSAGAVWLPVSNSHKIYVERKTGYNGTGSFYYEGYRRIGTNT